MKKKENTLSAKRLRYSYENKIGFEMKQKLKIVPTINMKWRGKTKEFICHCIIHSK